MDELEAGILAGDAGAVSSVLRRWQARAQEGTGQSPAETLARALERPLHADTQLTALHLACLTGHTEVLKVVLEGKPDLLKMDAKQRLPLHCAVEGGCRGTLEALAEAMDANGWTAKALTLRDARGLTPLHLACAKAPLLRFLLGYARDAQQVWSCEGLLRRAVASAPGALRALVEGAPRDGPLDAAEAKASESGRPLALLAAEHGSVENMALLQELGVDLAVADEDGQNALHWAVLLGHDDLAEWLSSANTELAAKLATHKDNAGRVPAEYAEPPEDAASPAVHDTTTGSNEAEQAEEDRDATGAQAASPAPKFAIPAVAVEAPTPPEASHTAPFLAR